MTHSAAAERLQQILDLAEREDRHLQAVRQRLLGDDCAVDAARLERLLADDAGIDRLESFAAKFSRLQDTIADKLAPALLGLLGEPARPVIDNLGQMERLGLIEDADSWLQMRGLRNRLVHEYIDRPDDLAVALTAACRFTASMHDDYLAIERYAVDRLDAT